MFILPQTADPTTSTTSEAPSTGSTLPGATTPLPSSVVFLEASLGYPFVSALENNQSDEFQDLAETVVGFVSERQIIHTILSGI